MPTSFLLRQHRRLLATVILMLAILQCLKSYIIFLYRYVAPLSRTLLCCQLICSYFIIMFCGLLKQNPLKHVPILSFSSFYTVDYYVVELLTKNKEDSIYISFINCKQGYSVFTNHLLTLRSLHVNCNAAR